MWSRFSCSRTPPAPHSNRFFVSSVRPPFLFALSLFLASGIGYVAGALVTARSIPSTPLTVTDDTRPLVPTLQIDGVENGAIVGQAKGELRVLVGGEAYVVTEGEFAIPGSVFREVLTVRVPEGMRFVASKNGTKYYDVTSAAGNRIDPDNRVYFRTAADAEAAGYKP